MHPTVVNGSVPSVVGGIRPPVGAGASRPSVGSVPRSAEGDILEPVEEYYGHGEELATGGAQVPTLQDEDIDGRFEDVTIFGDRFEDIHDDLLDNRMAKDNESGASLRRSQRRSKHQTEMSDSGNETVKKEKAKKMLFPIFSTLKRNLTQALSPEGKDQTEPSSKKSH